MTSTNIFYFSYFPKYCHLFAVFTDDDICIGAKMSHTASLLCMLVIKLKIFSDIYLGSNRLFQCLILNLK